ncbi:oxidoreductase, aldo/keto reductase family [Synechococcus sp. PCC 7335]|uniref:aldo/keto reductase n=1 Tax=Synechococcus sp. (strain ATCC 29403 / PCC 7335) TaxID=91464 RepID=UPI00017EC094|nr:aldo/keto reductase [Synechococcus sp. PCC 7335]EDX82996.1 oxidoreductase, aldo/keto reductase family [Synechococcus sp. PCC 7335]EDX83104.1 oxidoreductase, aldo/keto reductase family [Synechococcus sp. PCC 7335]
MFKNRKKFDPVRRGLLTGSAAAATAMALGARRTAAQSGTASVTSAPAPGRRMLGSLEVSEIGLGVQNMHRTFHTIVPNRGDMIQLIRTAFDEGVTFFDCAEVYGPHKCERILGEAMAPFRDQAQITTKFGFDVDLETGEFRGGVISDPARIRQAVEGSLRRLRTDRIDLLYQHRVDPNVPIEEVAGTVSDLMKEGKVLNWGLSEMGPNTLRRAHAALPVTAVQNEYSILYRGMEDDILPICQELGIGVVPFAPLGYGFLTGAVDMETMFAPSDFRALTSRMDPENREVNMALVELASNWANRKGVNPGQIALAWLMAQGPSIVPIPGTTQMPHLRDNIAAANVTFDAAELSEFTTALDAIEVQGERAPAIVMEWNGAEAREI